MSTVVETLSATSAIVIKTSGKVNRDVMLLARWIMALRVSLRSLDEALPAAIKDSDAPTSARATANLAIQNIEKILHALDEECISNLDAASANIDSVIEFAQDKAAFDQHHINDPAVRREVLAITNGRCAYCDVELVDRGGDGNQFCVEHVIPVSKGGPNHLVNYVPACRSCNNSKSDNHVLLFIRRNLPRKVSIVPVQTVEAAE